MNTPRRTGISGWMRLKHPEDIERALAKGINKILTSVIVLAMLADWQAFVMPECRVGGSDLIVKRL